MQNIQDVLFIKVSLLSLTNSFEHPVNHTAIKVEKKHPPAFVIIKINLFVVRKSMQMYIILENRSVVECHQVTSIFKVHLNV